MKLSKDLRHGRSAYGYSRSQACSVYRFGALTGMMCTLVTLLFASFGASQANATSFTASISTTTPVGTFARLGSSYNASVSTSTPTLTSEEKVTSTTYAWSSGDSVSPPDQQTTTVTVGPHPTGSYISSVSCVVTLAIFHKDTGNTVPISAIAPTAKVTIAFTGVNWDPDLNDPNDQLGSLTVFLGPPYNSPLYAPFNNNSNTSTTSLPIDVQPGSTIGFQTFALDDDRSKPIGATTWNDPVIGTGPYLMTFTTTGGGTFGSIDTPVLTKTFTSLQAHCPFTVVPTWTGGSPITVTASIVDNAVTHPTGATDPDTGCAADPTVNITWSLVKGGTCPTGMTLGPYTSTSSGLNPIDYAMVGPAPISQFQGDAITETFDTYDASGWTMADLKPSWQTSHSTLNTVPLVIGFLRANAATSTFTVDGTGHITDQIRSFSTVSNADLSAMFTKDVIGYSMSQHFSCGGTVSGPTIIHTSSIIETYTISTSNLSVSLH